MINTNNQSLRFRRLIEFWMKLVKLSTIIHTCEVLIEIFILELVLIETGTDIRTLIEFYSPIEYRSISVLAILL